MVVIAPITTGRAPKTTSALEASADELHPLLRHRPLRIYRLFMIRVDYCPD